MLVKALRLLSANRVNERVSATKWPLDHPFNCLTNSLCLCHLTAQRDPWGKGEREGGRREGKCLIAAENNGDCSEKRAANPLTETKGERINPT